MSRRKKYNGRPLGQPELRKRFFDTLKNIESMCEIYDNGKYEIYSSLSTELNKLFMEGDGTLIRNEFFYTTPGINVNPRALTPHMPLVSVKAESKADGVGILTHTHYFERVVEEKFIEKKFSDWWEKELVFVASSSPKDTPLGVLSLKGQISYSAREKMTRKELVKLVRDKIGSHTDKHIPVILDRLFDRRSWGNVIASRPLPNEDPEVTMQRDVVVNAPIHAMIRQIAAEVLLSIPQE